ncbi:unnamed protein product [Oppiella nova]|uniref:Uncharacterized protein n=1 Tax=Oppiella nova TaxID=334625 RepID=A0A7R9QHC9_9ACAR|nr:unnamed protein product [Oppiella nova]CAG2165960.1 unnamed protein product [Oppiella nova]
MSELRDLDVVNNYWLNCVAENDEEKFQKFQSLLCVPNKTDTSIVDKVIKCQRNETAEEIALIKANVSAYTKVDQTIMERKETLIMYCDKEFFNCMVKVFVDNKDLFDEQDRINKSKDKAVEEKTYL